jgi:hypothetical protein
MITGLLRYNPLLTGKVTYDYLVWASAILSLISVYGELRRLRDRPLYSTILLLVVGGVLVAGGRLMSIHMGSDKPGYKRDDMQDRRVHWG